MTIHLKYYPSGSIGICLAVFIGEVGVEGVVGVGVVGVGGVWIHLLLLLHIYTLPVTDKVIDFFQDHVHCVLLGVGGGRGGGCLDPSPAPAPHLYITSH